MFIVDSYSLAVIFCVVTMLCWGSWGNTQKLAGKTWRYELFYWDYVIGILAFSLLLGFTLGSTGDAGRGFVEDLKQISMENRGRHIQSVQHPFISFRLYGRAYGSIPVRSRHSLGIRCFRQLFR